jgi:AraC family transcriptional regulator, arabinose operon regulatory protein
MANRAGIPEGFAGQHLVVLPTAVRRQAERHPLLRGLLVTDAGVFPRAMAHYIERAKGAATTLLILCSAGRGWVRLPGQDLEVESGTLVWLPAGIPHAYGAADKAPWTIEWCHFTGEEVDAWRDLLQLPAAGGAIGLGAEAAEIRLARAWESLEHGYSVGNLVAASIALRAALSTASAARREAHGTRSAEERVAASAAWMKEHLAQPVRLNELAAMAGVSVPHYSMLFRRQTGFAPIDWLIRLRVQRACQLLDTTRATVAEIGADVGFADPYYFTRCFRRVMGLPPTRYRQVPKG